MSDITAGSLEGLLGRENRGLAQIAQTLKGMNRTREPLHLKYIPDELIQQRGPEPPKRPLPLYFAAMGVAAMLLGAAYANQTRDTTQVYSPVESVGMERSSEVQNLYD